MDGAHRYVKTPEEAVAAAVQQGLLSEADLDRALVRLRLGSLAPAGQRPFPDITAPQMLKLQVTGRAELPPF